MRNVLVDHARARRAHKRGGGGGARVDLDEAGVFVEDQIDSVLAVDETLGRLAAVDAQLAQIVELRFFGGLRDAEIAQSLGMSLRSVERAWRTARAWLARELERDGQDG
jgi:RNA polymerase sigma factor (TIGR02999 family)